MRYNNYHKHDDFSNIRTPDVIVKPSAYVERALELGHDTYFTTNHGSGGDVHIAYGACEKVNVNEENIREEIIKCIFGVEAYYVDDRFEKDRSNYHIVLIALNYEGYKDINRIISEANTTGFYHRPRIDLSLLLSLNPKNVVVTTACVNNKIFRGITNGEEVAKSFLFPVFKHFKNNFFLELQSHNEEIQRKWNKIILALSAKFGIKYIHANDSHYLYPKQAKDRDEYIKGKGIYYDNESDFILDYPDSDIILKRYDKQGILTREQVIIALENTLIFDKCEDLGFNKEVKMPTIYPELSVNERYNKLNSIVVSSLKKKIKGMSRSKALEYIEAVKFEMKIIKETNTPEVRTADYFLINHEIIKNGVEKYNGILTKTGRGCFTEDAIVHTEKTLKSIKDINVGDMVITSDGKFNKVKNTMSYDIDEELIQIKHLYGTDKHFPTICTLDHKILINRDECINWVEAKDIQLGDYVCTPKVKIYDSSLEFIDLNDYNVFGYNYDKEFIYEYSPYSNNEYQYSPTEVSNEIGVGKSVFEKFANGDKTVMTAKKKWARDMFFQKYPFDNQDEYVRYIKEKRTKKVRRFIKNDVIFNKFIGLMYGDGCAPQNRPYTIGLAINNLTEKDKINKEIFYKVANKFGLPVYENISKTKNLSQLYINSSLVASFVRSELFISENGKQKEFNPNLFNQSKENLKGIIRGLRLSDGSNEKYRISFDNTSKSLINAYKILCLMTNDGVNSLSLRNSWFHKDGYVCADAYKLRLNPNAKNANKKSERILEDDNYWYLPVKETILLPKTKTKVYDIEVENQHNYLINNMIVHNSAVSFLVNHLLGFTEIDRLDAEVPLYPTRFMSKSRILETRSMPDIDYNTADPVPFIKSSKDTLGEDGCYYMVAYGTLKMSGSFRLSCRVRNLDMVYYNDFAKEVGDVEKIKDKEEQKIEYERLLSNPNFGEILKDSEKFVGVIDSVSPSPCSFLLLEKSITEEIGLIKIGDNICCMIDGYTADEWGFLKNDILTVSVWDIISKCYEELGEPIPSIAELREKLDDDVWNLYAHGITRTLNQVDSDFGIQLITKYKPRNAGELTAFVAAIRPSFKSLLNGFLNRVYYTTGVPELDDLLEDSFHYLLYQENIMQYLTWLGIEEDETYGLIKKIGKKKLKEKRLATLQKTLRKNWVDNIGNDDKFDDTWQVIQDAAKYGFNSAHANSVAWDSLYGAELKAHHPLVYYTVVFDKYASNVEKTAQITKELDYFNIQLLPIKFRKSQASYSYDKKHRCIYKGIASLKFLNDTVSGELYELRQKKYPSFIALLEDIDKNTSINSRQIKILISLRFFSEFGKTKKLLEIYKLYSLIFNKKQFKKAELDRDGISEYLIKKYSDKETPKLYKEVDTYGLLYEMCIDIEDENLGLIENLHNEIEYMGYLSSTYSEAQNNIYYVSGFKQWQPNSPKPHLSLYRVRDGYTVEARIANKTIFPEQPFELGNIIIVHDMSEREKMKKVDDKWVKTGDYYNVVASYSLITREEESD